MAISEASAASSSGVFNDYPHDRRIIIYPIYINAKAKIVEGRRIGVKYCVDQPTLQEILDVLEHLGFEAEVEDKIYPRDIFQRGRVRVTLKDPVTGEPKVGNIASRKALLQEIGTMIPNLKSRKEGKPPASPAISTATTPSVMSPMGALGSPTSSASKTGSNKKKGAKKK
mmetsp:Transcript_24421/g.53268  ORF Transcript_24421/g.53268 Transcript_24421/m.53268 type:complete len:170 (+) Transcript_24421:274-783(+)